MMTEGVFKPLGTIICPHCGYQNLNWRIICAECHKDLEPDVIPEKPEREELSA